MTQPPIDPFQPHSDPGLPEREPPDPMVGFRIRRHYLRWVLILLGIPALYTLGYALAGDDNAGPALFQWGVLFAFFFGIGVYLSRRARRRQQ